MAFAAVPADAQQLLSNGDIRCRQAVGRGVRRLSRTLIKAIGKCHENRMLGRESQALDCNNPSTIPVKSGAKVSKAAAKLRTRAANRCTGASTPLTLGYEVCPPPCSSLPVSDYGEVAQCLVCVTKDRVATSSGDAFGTPIVPNGRTAETLCQVQIGKSLFTYFYQRMREQQKCQTLDDKRIIGATDCKSADLNGRIARTLAKTNDLLVRKCAENEANVFANLDSCGVDLATEQACIQANVEMYVDDLFDQVYPPPGPTIPPTPQVWFTPNVGSLDMIDLFATPAQWATARSNIDVFKFYSSQLFLEQPGGLNGQNILPNLVSARAFSLLNQWGIKTAFEADMAAISRRLNGNDSSPCQTRDWAMQELVAAAELPIANVETNGGVVSYIAMDEPLNKAGQFLRPEPPVSSCYSSIARITEDVAQYIAQVKSAHPSVIIGDIEPYPAFSISQMEQWITALENEGVSLSFFHLDVGMGLVAAYAAYGTPIDVAADLQELKSFLAVRNIAFGVIFDDSTWDAFAGKDANGNLLYNQDYSGLDYYANTIAFIQIVKSAIGQPGHRIFQSWRESWADPSTGLDFVRQLPVNLPEDNLSIFSHTRLINEGLAVLSGQ